MMVYKLAGMTAAMLDLSMVGMMVDMMADMMV